jgi:hypothetical protein
MHATPDSGPPIGASFRRGSELTTEAPPITRTAIGVPRPAREAPEVEQQVSRGAIVGWCVLGLIGWGVVIPIGWLAADAIRVLIP